MAAGKGSRRGNNEGSAYRYRNGWAGQVSMPDGTRKTVYGRTRDAVLDEIKKVRRAIDDGVPVVTTRMTVGEYLEQWVTVVLPSRVVAGTLAESTAESYELLVRLHIIPVLGRHELRKLSTAHVRQWMTAKLTEPSAAGVAARRRREEEKARRAAEKEAQKQVVGTDRPQRPRGRKPGKPKRVQTPEPKPIKPLSARSVRYLLTILRLALKDAVREELLVRNVADLVQPPRKDDAPVRALTEAEAGRVLAVALVDRLAALWMIMLALGLRKGEALGLRWDVVDLDAGTVQIRRKQRRRLVGVDPDTGRKRWELVEDDQLKTKGSKATLALPEMVVVVLREHKARQSAAKEAAKVWHDDGLVFTTATGRGIQPRNVNRWWDKVCADAGVRRTRVHDLRHTSATLLFRAGVDLNEIRALLRHTRIATTADIYIDVLEDVRRGTAASMDTILDRLFPPTRPDATESDDDAGGVGVSES
ncbi:tyrosine-type recombinase/integrase [Protofrankia coriariae]|uniref:Integrase n=1 Tax=Protofrankia coriariae TaxID=1562887 RepID=A0ABR5F2A7_9ACTN|nr:site-specific integrase [Protofrankia coriariae]KLL10830.1 integrase [Protofrankia coriariae]